MYVKTIFVLVAILLISTAHFSFADEPERVDQGYNPTNAPVRTNEEGSATAIQEDRVQTVLDPRLMSVERDFSERFAALENEIEQLMWGEEKLTLERQAENLKREWHIALTRVHLQIATEKGDQNTVAEMSTHLQKLEHPESPVFHNVRRDPNTGAVLDGGQQ